MRLTRPSIDPRKNGPRRRALGTGGLLAPCERAPAQRLFRAEPLWGTCVAAFSYYKGQLSADRSEPALPRIAFITATPMNACEGSGCSWESKRSPEHSGGWE